MTTLTGEHYELTYADQVAVVTEVGATLRSYGVADIPVVDGFAATALPDGARGQVLAPWPNRIRGGRYTFDGQELQLALTEPSAQNATHGLVRWAGWALTEQSPSRVVLTTTVWPQPGYPFLLRMRAVYALGDDGLRVTLSARNDGDRPAPYGVGQHPYITLGGRVDEGTLTVPAARRLRVDERRIPVGDEPVAGTPYDFNAARRLGDLVLDTTFAALRRGPDGRAVVRLAGAAREVLIWMDPAAKYVQLFTGETLPDPTRRRAGIAVEPMTCPPNAFVSGTGLVRLAPGERHELSWGIQVAAGPSPGSHPT